MIELDVGDLDDILDAVENIEKNAAEKIPGVIRRLVLEAKNEADMGFGNATANGDILMSVSVSEDNGDKVYDINADGEAVTFVEFGTGIWGGEHPIGHQLGFIHGQFGQKKGSNPGGWVYYDKKRGVVRFTRGQPARRAMWSAAENLEYRLEEADYSL